MHTKINSAPDREIRLALPKGRILAETEQVLNALNIRPEADFYDSKSRKLSFVTNVPNLSVIRVRSFDVATFVTTKAADFAICGLDVIREFNYKNILNLTSLDIGKCRLSLAAKDETDIKNIASHIKVATKYPNLSKKFFKKQGLQCEIIKLNGAIELAVSLKLCDAIIDLVSTGNTLKENHLVEKESILDINSCLIANRNSFNANLDFFKAILNTLENEAK